MYLINFPLIEYSIHFDDWIMQHLLEWNPYSKMQIYQLDGSLLDRQEMAIHKKRRQRSGIDTIKHNITIESQEVSPFPAGDHKASINRHAQKHNKDQFNKHN